MTIALISSLYRSEQHLPTFTASLFGFAKRVSEAGIDVHYLPIVNDATRPEREAIGRLAQTINAKYYGRMTPHYVPRESLYASWNRALGHTQADCFAPWNADDIRSDRAFVAGYRALQNGADLVDFPFTRVLRHKRLGVFAREQRIAVPCPFAQDSLSRRHGLSPFFMASALLYRRLGHFDPHFQVAGDTEWAGRATSGVRFQSVESSGGEFLVHGDNLSNTGSEREDIEVNIIFMRRGAWARLRPVNPGAMRQAWERWGNPAGIELSAEIEDFLWGPAAGARWQRYQRERRQPPLLRRLRLALAARGLIHSLEWSLAQQSRDRR